jgi:hypothetical protein
VRSSPFPANTWRRVAVGGGAPAQVATSNSIVPASYTIPATGVIAHIQVVSTGGGDIDVTSSCLSAELSDSGIIPGGPPDHRVNWQRGDLHAVIYPAHDDSGNPTIHIYCVDENSNGFLALVITEADLDGFDHTPAANTLVKSSDLCPVAFYILTTGEYQINIGLVATGGNYEVIFSGLAMNALYYGYFNLYQFE